MAGLIIYSCHRGPAPSCLPSPGRHQAEFNNYTSTTSTPEQRKSRREHSVMHREPCACASQPARCRRVACRMSHAHGRCAHVAPADGRSLGVDAEYGQHCAQRVRVLVRVVTHASAPGIIATPDSVHAGTPYTVHGVHGARGTPHWRDTCRVGGSPQRRVDSAPVPVYGVLCTLGRSVPTSLRVPGRSLPA
jgi:hypothetical protein